MPCSSAGFTTDDIPLLFAVSWLIAATLPAACLGSGTDGGGRNNDTTTFLYSYPSSFNKDPDGRSQLQFSWDAGVLDGAIHLTADDVYQPPVVYPPDGKRSAGRVILRAGPQDTGYGRYYAREELRSHDLSFNTSFTTSVVAAGGGGHNRDDGGLLLQVLPSIDPEAVDSTVYYSLDRTTTSFNVTVEIGTLEYRYYDTRTLNPYTFGYTRPTTTTYYDRKTISGVYVSVSPDWTTPAAKHTVWVEYDDVGHNMWVYVDDGGKPKPGQATLHTRFDIDEIFGERDDYDPYKFLGLFASRNRSLPSCRPVIYSWNVTADIIISKSTENEGEYQYHYDRPRRKSVWFLAAIIVASVLVAAGAVVTLVAWMWSRLVSWYRALVMRIKLSRALRRLPGIPREFKFAHVRKATRNFHDGNRLGSGGFGAVFKGTMVTRSVTGEGRRRRQRVDVAVKKFTRKDDRGYDDFMAEVAIINRLRHRNIVPLLGWCYEKGELLLIYQYMPNGSLDQHLFRHRQRQQDVDTTTTLRWETRYQVVADVAAALHYVHHEYERVVLHRDIKASNVMLDADFRGRLGDFGLAGLVDDANKNSLSDLAVAGTWGFIAPEYPVSHKATRRTDVYAFGVLVLEVVTGKRSLGEAGTEFQLLTDWVWSLHGEGRLLEAVDDDLLTAAAAGDEVDQPDVSTRLLDSVDLVGTGAAGGELQFHAADDAIRLLLLGLACTNPNPSDRPSTAELVQVIAKRIPPPVVPQVKPSFVWPLEGELPALDDDLELDDDFVEVVSQVDEEPDDHSRTLSREGLALSIGSLSLEIMVCRSRRSLP